MGISGGNEDRRLLDSSTRYGDDALCRHCCFGGVSYGRLALNLLPEISYPTLTIRTHYEGAAPAEVENLITETVENAVSVANNVVLVSSVSKAEVSDVILEFSWRTNMDFAALDVREKLDALQLPLDAGKPILLRYDPSTDPIMRISVSGSSDLSGIRYLCEEFVSPIWKALMVWRPSRVSGGFEEEIQSSWMSRNLPHWECPFRK